MNSETILKNQCTKWLKANGIFYFKLSDKFYSGVPDLLIIHETKYVWIELKTQTGKVSEIQKWTIKLITKHGGWAYVARSLDELKEILRGLHILKA